MQKYEMLILLKADMEHEARDAELKKYAEIVTSMGGSVEGIEEMDVKKTPYPIQVRAEAFFALIKFSADGKTVRELDRIAGISDAVLRRMIVKTEEK